MAQSKADRIGLKINLAQYEFSRGLTPVKHHPGIVVHWMGPGAFGNDKRHPGQLVHSIHQAQKYSGIGYHGIVTQAGAYYQGRPYLHRGAHCAERGVVDKNDHFGLLWFGGNGGPGGKPEHPTPEAIETLAKVVAWVCLDQDIPCDRAHVKGHREWLSTECPGTLFKPLDKVVARARQILIEIEKEPVPPPAPKIDTLKVVIQTDKGAHEAAGLLLSGRSYIPAGELQRLGIPVQFKPAGANEKDPTLFIGPAPHA